MTDNADDFDWQPSNPRRYGIAYTVFGAALACAALGFIFGNAYPLRTLIEVVERNGVPLTPNTRSEHPTDSRNTTGETAASAPDMQADRGRSEVVQVTGPRQLGPTGTERDHFSQHGTARPVRLLNPGSADRSPTKPRHMEQQDIAGTADPAARAKRGIAPNPSLERRAKSTRLAADNKVLVVVRRAGSPFDTKVLRGRIRDGHLVVSRQDLKGIILRY